MITPTRRIMSIQVILANCKKPGFRVAVVRTKDNSPILKFVGSEIAMWEAPLPEHDIVEIDGVPISLVLDSPPTGDVMIRIFERKEEETE